MYWTPQRLAAFRLASCPEIGSRTLTRIKEHSPDIDTFLADPDAWKAAGLTDAQQSALQKTHPDPTALDRSGVRILLPDDAEFPVTLLKQPDAPFAVFVRGSLPPDALSVAVVGTRRMTDYGKRATRLVVEELTHAGVAIISGLALGVDAEAHEACLAGGGRTVAVLPGGVDHASVVPPRNRDLAERILGADGALLSEHPPGFPVREFSFLHRNRHIAALASAVVVPEADRDSGALVTARLALESGREVLAVPGPIWSAASRGTNWLISQGARPCCSAEDIFSALNLRDPGHAKQLSDARASIPVEPEEQLLLDHLDAPRTADELARLLSQPIAQTSALMTVLELKGRIISVGPRTFVKTP